MQVATAKVTIRCTRQDPGFNELRRKMESNSARAVYNFARRGTMYVRAGAPVDTGYMKTQVEWVRLSKGVFEIRVNGNVDANTGAYYAIYVEYGTRNMAAQPFFRPGIERAKKEFREDMRGVFK